MKKMKALMVALVAVLVCVGKVNATPQKTIDASACETIYTNYYFFLDANSPAYFSKGVTGVSHSTVGEFVNNSYLTTNFSMENIGYGRVNISKSTTTTADGITSMSLNDYYTYYLMAVNSSGGSYSNGTKNYITHGKWYNVNPDGTVTSHDGNLYLATYSKQDLINASLNAINNFTLLSTVSPSILNPFQIRIDRSYIGALTGMPVSVGGKDWYLQPAIFYVQYCSPKTNGRNYTVRYHGNGSNVTDVPNIQTEKVGSCVTISNRPTRPGYKFVGWSRRSTVSDSIRMPGDSYCGTEGNIDLYAIWEKEQVAPIETYYTITYIANGDGVSGLPDPQTKNSDYDDYISSNRPTRNGHEFLGWSTSAADTTGNPIYAPGSKYSDRKDITLYAIWRKKTEPVLPENPKTGITDYLIPFGGVISASGLGLGLLKKKKKFKQF